MILIYDLLTLYFSGEVTLSLRKMLPQIFFCKQIQTRKCNKTTMKIYPSQIITILILLLTPQIYHVSVPVTPI